MSGYLVFAAFPSPSLVGNAEMRVRAAPKIDQDYSAARPLRHAASLSHSTIHLSLSLSLSHSLSILPVSLLTQHVRLLTFILHLLYNDLSIYLTISHPPSIYLLLSIYPSSYLSIYQAISIYQSIKPLLYHVNLCALLLYSIYRR